MYTYGPFGNLLESDGTFDNAFMYTGREYDAGTGLYYYRGRYYNPQIGRFLQPDPIGYAGGINLYSYCANNPINWVDPLGTEKSKNRNSGILGWLGALNDVGTWALGNAPSYVEYGPNSRQAFDMRNAFSVRQARQTMRIMNMTVRAGRIVLRTGNDIHAQFGLPGENRWVFRTNFNPTQLFLGGYSIDIIPHAERGTQEVRIHNNWTLGSASRIANKGLGLVRSPIRMPSSWRADYGPGASSLQLIWWEEPLYHQ